MNIITLVILMTLSIVFIASIGAFGALIYGIKKGNVWVSDSVTMPRSWYNIFCVLLIINVICAMILITLLFVKLPV